MKPRRACLAIALRLFLAHESTGRACLIPLGHDAEGMLDGRLAKLARAGVGGHDVAP